MSSEESKFRPLKRMPARQIPQPEAIEILKQGEYGVLALIDSNNGYPYGVPVNYLYLKGNLYFHCGQKGQKEEIIQINNKACFTVVLDAKVLPQLHSTAYRSTIVFGRCTLVSDAEKEGILLSFAHHFAPGFSEKTIDNMKKYSSVTDVIKFEIDYLTGKQRKE